MNPFAFLKSHVAILDVVKEYATLRPAGSYWKGRCPFHQERTASFTVSPHREIFYCFGCHKGGDVIKFIQEVEHCTPFEAVKQLADRWNITLPAQFKWDDHEKKAHRFDDYVRLCTTVATWFSKHLVPKSPAYHYIRERNISSNLIAEYSLGTMPAHRVSHLLEYVKDEGFMAQDLINAHIIFEGKHELYSPFEDRIIFPIKDHLGRINGFGGRIFNPNDERPKYYNTQDHTYFVKGSLLYGLDRAKKEIQEHQNVFLAEGYMDCLALVQAGYRHTVATLGTACTIEHLHVLARYTDKITIVFDGDHAGQQAVLRVAQLAWQIPLELTVVTLPVDEDPASLLEQPATLHQCIEKAEDIFNVILQRAQQSPTFTSITTRIQSMQEVIHMVKTISDPLKQNIILHKIAQTFGVPVDSLVHTLTMPEATEHSPEKTSTLHYLERQLLSIVLHNPQALTEEDCTLIRHICSPLFITCIEQIQECEGEYTQLLDIFTGNERELIAELIMNNEPSHETIHDTLEQLCRREWKRITHNISQRLSHAQKTNDKDAIQSLMHEFYEVKEYMKSRGIV